MTEALQPAAHPADAEILNTVELAKLLGCDKETAEKRIIAGDLPGSKFGRGWIIPRRALIERINEMAMQDAKARKTALEAERVQAVGRAQVADTEPSPALPTSELKTLRKGLRRTPPSLPSMPTTTY